MTDSLRIHDADHDGGPGGLAELLSLPLASIWSAVTSQVGGAVNTAVAASPSLEATSRSQETDAAIASSIVAADSTGQTTLPSTLLTTTTIAALVPSSLVVPSILSTVDQVTATSVSGGSLTTSNPTSLDSIILKAAPTTDTAPSSTPLSSTLTFPLESYKPSTNTSSPTGNHQAAGHASHRRGVIIGLSIMIAALLIGGIVFGLCLQRRRKLRERSITPWDEKGFLENSHQPSFTPPLRWSNGVTRLESGSPAPPPQVHSRNKAASVDEDHHIIRMNTHHWHRPFIQGRGEGIRESNGPGLLRVMNPDLSRPSTPDLFGTKKTTPIVTSVFLQQQQQQQQPSRSRTPSSLLTYHRQSTTQIPHITLHSALSRKHSTSTTSTNLYAPSLPIVQQHPLEDPFLTPPDDDVPSDWPLPAHPIPEPKRTLLRPFRTSVTHRFCTARSSSSARSSTTSSTTSRLAPPGSRYSDPFDLDHRSARSSAVHGDSSTSKAAGPEGSCGLYYGT
nr:hypothetical protein CFP56_70517 [Quercus suber]